MSGIADKSRELRAFAPAFILLAICALINYVDRGNLSIAAPLLKHELRISASQLGILLSAFFGPTPQCSLSAAGWWTALTPTG
jgi:sugar phosphate permease